MAQTLTQIKGLLAARGLHPKKRFGQNFLHDHHQMQRIMDAALVQPGECVLEVGPGTGALSERLLQAGARLIAIEVDGDMEPILRAELAPYADRLTLLIGDVLAGKRHINPDVLAALGDQPYKLVANLPYNTASPLIANLVAKPGLRLAIVMLQKEVADRLTAPPGGKDYGPLGVMVQALCVVNRVAVLSPGCFWPQPEIDSAVVRLIPRATPLTNNPEQLGAGLQVLFNQRRKQIGSIVGRQRTLPAGIDPVSRPEQLSVEQLVTLSEWLAAETENP